MGGQNVSSNVKLYFNHRTELTIYQHLILKKELFIIPLGLRILIPE